MNRAAGYVDERGRFWVGTDRGLSLVLPSERSGASPSVAFVEAAHGDTPIALTADTARGSLDPGPLTFRFRATAFLDERRTRFRYRLDGHDAAWRGPVELPTRELTYAALQPGTYRLHLQAIGADGRESEVVASPAITIPTPLHHRLWFRAALVVAAVGAAWALFAQRVQRRYARRLEEEVQLRTTQLKVSEHNLAGVLASIGDGVAATDGTGRVLLWNEAAARLTGRGKDAVLGRPLAEVLGVDGALPRDGVLQFEARTSEGDARQFEASAAALGAEGQVVAFRDVTERLAIERDLARGQRLESLGLLAGGIAHDFNNYLTVVIGTLGMLRGEAALDTDQRDQLRVAEDTLNRAVSLTQQLLTFSTGGAPMRRDVDLEGLLRDAVAFALSGSSVVARLEVEAGLPPAHVDAGQVSQVLHNLLLNARQAMTDGGEVVLRATRAEGAWVAVEVEDEGPGMSSDVQARVFEPFFTSREGGTGLGLAIVHSIVARHGGQVVVDSTPGRGTCFRLLLPAAESARVVTNPAAPPPGERAVHVLVMDDESSIRDLVQRMLDRLGHTCEVVEDGARAVERYDAARAAGAPFDVVLLDLTVIGGMGGREAARRILELDPHARLVAASGYSNDAVLGEHGDSGFVAALAKPFRMAELQELLLRVSAGAGR